MRKEEFSIIGMHCAACVGRVEKVVSKLWCRRCESQFADQ